MIPDEAVEAAVHAYMQYPRTRGLDNTANMFRAALEAAAPHMLAEAWDEGEEAGGLNHAAEEYPHLEQVTNPYR